jgi:hypothetical protein
MLWTRLSVHQAAHSSPLYSEDLLTLTGEQEGMVFLTLLDSALQEDPRLWVVATLRLEFLNGFLTTDFAPLFSKPVAIGALGRAALFEVIEEPAARADLTFGRGSRTSWLTIPAGGRAVLLPTPFRRSTAVSGRAGWSLLRTTISLAVWRVRCPSKLTG